MHVYLPCSPFYSARSPGERTGRGAARRAGFTGLREPRTHRGGAKEHISVRSETGDVPARDVLIKCRGGVQKTVKRSHRAHIPHGDVGVEVRVAGIAGFATRSRNRGVPGEKPAAHVGDQSVVPGRHLVTARDTARKAITARAVGL